MRVRIFFISYQSVLFLCNIAVVLLHIITIAVYIYTYIMKRIYIHLVVGLIASVLLGLSQGAPAQAATPASLGVAPLGQGPIAAMTSPLRLSADVDFEDLNDVGSIECGDGDSAGGNILDLDVGGLVVNYVICPMMQAMYQGVILIIGMIEQGGLLGVSPLLSDGRPSDKTAGIFAAWSVFRDLANFGLVIGLFLVIFSQATSYGLSAYGVRKMLPKIVIAALLINLSYVICAVLVDVFNILGTSLDDLLTNAITAATAGAQSGGILAGEGGAANALMAGGTLVLVMAPLLLIIFFILVLIGIVGIFFLIARQILIVCLIVAAPIAFISWLFPNTESYFRKWWSTLIRLLAIYPVVTCLNAVVLVLLIAMSNLVS